MAAGLNGKMDAGQPVDHGQEELCLQQGFSAGEGDAVGDVQALFQSGSQLVCSDLIAGDREKSLGTDVQTSAVGLTVRMTAASAAQAAAAAGVFPEIQLGLGRETLGVVTLDAAQWTALEKHTGTKTGTVVDSHFFDIKEDPGHRQYSWRAIT